MPAGRDAEPAAGGRADLIPRVLTLLMLGGLVWLAAGGAITKQVMRHRADLGSHIRAVCYWDLRSVRVGDLEMTYTTWHSRVGQQPPEDLGHFVEEAHAENLAKIAAVRRYGQVGLGILCLGGPLLLWNLVRPRGHPARLLLVHGLVLVTIATACITFHLGLRSVYPPLPGDSKSLALPAIIALSVGTLSLLLLFVWVRRDRRGHAEGSGRRDGP